MTKLEELIQHLCPDGVEFKDLGNIVKISNGKDHKHLEDGKFPVYGSGGIMRYANQFMYGDESVLIPRKGSIGNIFYVNNPFWTVDTIFYTKINKEIITPKFLYFFLKTLHLQDLNFAGGVPSLTKTILDKLQIPVPPLPIQQEIVTILDSFTQLEAELEAELEARRAQYDYYRNQLLNFEGKEVEWKTLGEVAYYSKSRISADSIDCNNYIGVENLLQNRQGKTTSNYVPLSGQLIEYMINDVLIGNIRPYLKKIWRASNNGGTNGDVIVIRLNNDFNKKIKPEYLYHLLASDAFFIYNMQFAKGAKMPRGDKSAILKYGVPIPPFSEQERIVTILNKFDALINDLSVGLPAEIEARRKQYAYYRGKLLNFKRKNDLTKESPEITI